MAPGDKWYCGGYFSHAVLDSIPVWQTRDYEDPSVLRARRFVKFGSPALYGR